MYGPGGVGGAQESDRGAIGEIVHSTHYFALGSTSVVGEEKRWEFTSVCGLQVVEQNDDQEQVSPSENRRPDGSVAWRVGVFQDRFTVGIPPDLGKGRWCVEDNLQVPVWKLRVCGYAFWCDQCSGCVYGLHEQDFQTFLR